MHAMKSSIGILILFSQLLSSAGQTYNALIQELERALDHKSEYITQREDLIQAKKEELNVFRSTNDLRNQIFTCLDLVYEYQSFIYDSAYFYVSQAKNTALLLDDETLINQIKIREGFVLLSSGLFKEAIDTLFSIRVNYLNDSLKSNLYATLARAYFDLADYERDPVFMPAYII